MPKVETKSLGVWVNIRLPKDLKERVRVMAESEDRSFSYVTRMLLHYAIDAIERKANGGDVTAAEKAVTKAGVKQR